MIKYMFSNLLTFSLVNRLRKGVHGLQGSIVNYNELRRFYKPTLYQTFHVPKDDEAPNQTIGDVKRDSPRLLGFEDLNFNPDEFKDTMKKRAAFAKYMPKSQDEIPSRKMSDSFIMASIPVGSQPELRNLYASPHNHIRVGRMIENLDTFCVYIGFKHVYFPTKPDVKLTYGLMTTLMDSIILTGYKPRGDVDLRMYGHVSWTGKSSCEVIAMIDQQAEDNSGPKLIAQCVCVLIVKDMLNNKLGYANRMDATSQEEKDYLKGGDARAALRKEKILSAVFKKPSTEEERKYVRDTFYNLRDIFTLSSHGLKSFGSNEPSILMKDTCLSSIKITQAQDRNHYYTVFGGYTLRHSYELAFTTAWIFSKQKQQPTLRCADDLSFKLPIFIGDVLRFTAAVGFVENNLIHCFVTLRILNPSSGTSNTSNTFHYIFQASEDAKLPIVVPVSYEETMLYIDCMRRFKKLQSLKVL